jgi:cysteinyl-tRNA synthetase
MDEIPAYIAQLVDQNLAYEANGSVYFHVEAFEASDGMHYCKLEPEQINNAALLAEAEGKLSQDFVGDKKSPRDFALWKRSKEGEPSWDSPWGPGRPGWHIECSVMASDVLARLFGGNVQMDIHSGGVDLRFPHHDNEMAQAEAHSGCHQWVNYFVHAGHLDIKGFKMSKSLKNFISIQDALKQNTARQIRLCFLLHKYNASMDYGDSTMSHTLVMEKLFVEFFHNVKAVLRETSTMGDSQKLNEASLIVQAAVMATKRKVDAALRDDFDTPTSLHALADLVRSTNLHLESGQLVSLVIRNAAVFITSMFRVFGLIPDGSTEIGFPMSVDGGAGGDGEEALTPVLNALMDFRASVRDKAKNKDVGGVLQECDSFRDDALPTLGIRLEDKAGGKSVWKLADPADLAREKEQKEAELARRAAEQAAQAAERAAKEALAKLPPIDFMKQLFLSDDTATTTTPTTTTTTPKYSRFDDTTGLPTHAHDGEALNKNQSKKAKKEFDAQQKKYDKYLKSQAK